MKDCKIDVKERHLVFDVKDVYYLEKKLDYDVVEDQASAKFDRKRKELRIVLPIVQAEEVVHKIPDDVPLESDEIEESEVKEGSDRVVDEEKERVEECNKGVEKDCEMDIEKDNEKDIEKESEIVGDKVQEIGGYDQTKNEVMEDRFESGDGDKENAGNKEENFEVGGGIDKKVETVQVSAKVVKPQPCCIKLKCPLLYSLS